MCRRKTKTITAEDLIKEGYKPSRTIYRFIIVNKDSSKKEKNNEPSKN